MAHWTLHVPYNIHVSYRLTYQSVLWNTHGHFSPNLAHHMDNIWYIGHWMPHIISTLVMDWAVCQCYGISMDISFPYLSYTLISISCSFHRFPIAYKLLNLHPTSVPYHHLVFSCHSYIWATYGPSFAIPFPHYHCSSGLPLWRYTRMIEARCSHYSKYTGKSLSGLSNVKNL